MSYLGVAEALIARMEGQPKTFVPALPKKPDHTVVGNAEVATTLRDSAKVCIAQVDIPIFFIDGSGADIDQVPCFSCNVISVTPRYDNFVFQSESYKGDYSYEKVGHSKSTIKDSNGEVIGTDSMLLRERRVMHPFDFLIEIRAEADDDVLMAMMVQHVYANVFEPRDFIRVPMLDGSYRSWDVLHKDFQSLDRRRAARAGTPGIERLYTKVWTYLIEGYLDNTDTTTLVNAVRSRRINLTKQGE